MGHYAKIENNIVVQVDVIDEEYFEENKNSLYKGKWIQTSYNTRAGVHLLGGTPLRKNYAGIGFTYDKQRDAFIPPKPSENYKLDEETCQWILDENDL
jgi:hypothetical protein